MTSASELFYNRRSRIGRDDVELGLGSSSSLDRNYHHNHGRRRYHHRHQLQQQQQRRDVEDCNPVRRSPHARHLCHREHEPVRVDNITSQSRTGNSSSTEILQNRSNRLRSSHNDRLPGDVLLARERLLERLRGVSLTGNRQGIGFSSGLSLDEFAYSDDVRHVDVGEWETEAPREWLAGGSQFPDSPTLTDVLSSSQDSRIKKAPGLSEEEVNCLYQELFSNEVKSGVVLGVAECSICLERFGEGDRLICLPCGHRFHSACLEPWVRRCGDCPYCRTRIVLAQHKRGSA